MEKQSSIVIYATEDGSTNLQVKFEKDTVWLTQAQMSDLFQKDQSVIARHISNVFKEGELEKESNMQILHNTLSKYKPTSVYSLDVIISVGYRVKSKRGVPFRQWANKVLKEYLVKGYAINKDIQIERYNELKEVVRLMSRAITLQEKATEMEYSGLFNVITDYVYALDTLDRYDYQTLSIDSTTKEESFRATYENAMLAIHSLKEKFGGSRWFANEKDDSFKSSIGQIYQTFAGEDLYPSVEEKAAMLFLWFMERNGILYGENGRKRIADNTLVALTLMIAESRTEEKDVMVQLSLSGIGRKCSECDVPSRLIKCIRRWKLR